MEEAIEELKTAKTKLDTAETKLADAETELIDAKKELTEAKKELNDAKKKLADAQSQYDYHTVDRPQQITDDYNLAQQVVTRCSNAVDSLRVLFVSLKKDVQNLSAAAAAPGKFER